MRTLLFILGLSLLTTSWADTLMLYHEPESDGPILRRIFPQSAIRSRALPDDLPMRAFSLDFVQRFCGHSAGFPEHLRCGAIQSEPSIPIPFLTSMRGLFEINNLMRDNNSIDDITQNIELLAKVHGPRLLAPLASRRVGWSTKAQPTLFWYLDWYIDKPWQGKMRLIFKCETKVEKQIVLKPTDITVFEKFYKIDLNGFDIELIQGTEYYWFIVLGEDKKNLAQAPLVQGAIKHIPMSNQIQNLPVTQQIVNYAKQGFWYDAIAILAENHTKEPFRRYWEMLLKDEELTMLLEQDAE